MQKELNKEQIISILQKYSPTKDNILKCLHELQDAHPQNYISKVILEETAKHFKLTKGQIFGIVSYYSMFSLKPRGRYLVRLCKSPVCNMLGAKSVTEYFDSKFNLKPGETTTDGMFTLELAECLGRCGKGPSMMINREVVTELDSKKIDEIINTKK
ncbi:MAG: NAD(P)H-dependent oxidoreductase subunit E [Bacteroidetes bacterium]|nr:NAD(P)H-dependent oxidoreductase subunit E [Bacteroidota bacterium]